MKNLNTIIIGLLVLAVLAYQSIFVVPEDADLLLPGESCLGSRPISEFFS